MTENKTEQYGWSQEMSTALIDKLKADLKHAMLNKDIQARSAIRQIMAEFPRLTVPITLESGKKTTRPNPICPRWLPAKRSLAGLRQT
jgi:hypothetical protein